MNDSLKFENTAQVGDTIKALDFQPMEGRDDHFIVGRVIKKGDVVHPEFGVTMFKGFHIEITGADREEDSRIGDIGFVPFEMDFDFDNRVQVVA